MSDKKPVIFISYSHKDEPEHDSDGDIHWLGDILSYVAPAANGTYELWTDEDIIGGTDWESKIKEKLAACDICILLVSRHSLASKYVIEVEIDTILKRQQLGHSVQLYPIVLSPFPQAAAPASLLALNFRPRLDKPLSGFSRHNRGVAISKIADEIVGILRSKTRATANVRTEPPKQPAFVHITGLPETAYERLVGRESELKSLDDAWADRNINILSLIAEGGAGKSALVNEWLTRLRADNYRGAESILGWSFYSQGTKERAASAEQFLNWGLEKLGVKIETTSAIAKGEAIAEAMTKRPVLLVLDGCEPLQHGLDKQRGGLKDQGLQALLRRFAAMPPADTHGLVVLTSRLPITDIARWKDGSAPLVDIEKLSDDAGAALLRDNGVWGTDKELREAVRDFGGHPLALGLLASFLKETQFGDLRRRDHIRAFFADAENPRHDHAKRVMESYEKEWLAGQPVLLSVMLLVGLFDRPASADCLQALRAKPSIKRLTDAIVSLNDDEWQRAIMRLRDVRLLAPPDPSAPGALDAHPLVREWFGERLKAKNTKAWRQAHGRLYEHLRDTTREGGTPTLEDLAPLYQAIAHGCQSGRHQETFYDVYEKRISRFSEAYAFLKLGAVGSDLAAVAWFFTAPYNTPVASLEQRAQTSLLHLASGCLVAEGRLAEMLSAAATNLRRLETAEEWLYAGAVANMLSQVQLIQGSITESLATSEKSIEYSDRSGSVHRMVVSRATYANALHAAGRRETAGQMFDDAEQRQCAYDSDQPLLHGFRGFAYCDFLIGGGNWIAARDRARQTIAIAQGQGWLLQTALDNLTLARAYLGMALDKYDGSEVESRSSMATIARDKFEESIVGLKRSAQKDDVPRGFLARAVLCRSVGNWEGAARDLDEVEELAEPGPMRLFLCDVALERGRISLARLGAFAPLNGVIADCPLRPVVPDSTEAANLKEMAAKQLAIAADYIEACGYHKRTEELAELRAVLRGERKFADLPPRV